jgi:7-cyano-7-deazaguanine synthase in queuosine biosynthesis
MTQTDEAAENEQIAAPQTAAEQRSRVARPNRNVALLLIGATLVFLAGAFGVAILAHYARF